MAKQGGFSYTKLALYLPYMPFYNTMMKRKYIHYWLSLALFLFYFVSFEDWLSHIIYYHEQHHLFLYALDYIHDNTLKECIVAFFVQFFYLPHMGSTLLAAILVAIYLLTWWILTRITYHEDLLQLSLIPSLANWIWLTSVKHSVLPLLISFSTLLVATILISFFVSHKPIKYFSVKKHRWLLLALSIYTVGGYYYFLKQYSIREYRMIKAQQALQQNNWDEVLYQTKRYLDFQQQQNPLILYFRNIALYKKGILLEHLLDYPMKIGVNALYFPWKSRSRETEYGHYLLEELGAINDAQHWEFEAMVVWGETAPRLINLASYAIANERYNIARHYIDRLKQALFYKNEVAQLEAYLKDKKIPHLQTFQKQAPQKANFINVMNIGPNLEYILQCNRNNKMAYDYLMCYLLLSNNAQKLIEHLPEYKRFYNQMPTVLQEALIVCQLGGVNAKKLSATSATIVRFERYCKLAQQENSEVLYREFKNSYWFYLNYISPYGNKIKN